MAMEQAMSVLMQLREELLTIDPSIVSDPRLYTDMLDAEGGNALDVFDRVIRSIIDNEDMVEAAKRRIEIIEERKARYEAVAAALRRKAKEALLTLGIEKRETEDFTAYMGKGKTKVLVPHPEKLPKGYRRITVTDVPDKDAIGKALMSGVAVEGAELSNAEPSFSIRTR